MVMDYVGVIVLSCFIACAILSPILCVILARRRERQKYRPKPKAFQKAKRKLGPVTECISRSDNANEDDEAWIGDCPICMGPLCRVASQENLTEKDCSVPVTARGALAAPTSGGAPSPAPPAHPADRPAPAAEPAPAESPSSANARPTGSPHRGKESQPAPFKATAMAEEETAVAGEEETGEGSNDVSTNHAGPGVGTGILKSTKKAGGGGAVKQPTSLGAGRDTEVLRLKACGHAFHSRCLLSWFLTERHDCPVCRTRFWAGPPSRNWFVTGQASYTAASARMTVGVVV